MKHTEKASSKTQAAGALLFLSEDVEKASEMANYFPKEAAVTCTSRTFTSHALMAETHALGFTEKEAEK